MPMNPRLLRPRQAGGFTPRSIAGCTGWLDASNSSTITLNGSTVSEWRNLGSAGGAYSQATAANQPSTSTINGRTAIAFTAGQVFLGGGPSTSVLSAGLSAICIFAVYRVVASTHTIRLLALAGTNSIGSFGVFASLSGSVFWDAPEATARVSGSAAALNATVVSRFIRDGATASIHRNGASIASRSNATGSIPSGATVWGHDNSSSQNVAHLAEVVVYSQTPSAAGISAIERYLGAKWGVTVA